MTLVRQFTRNDIEALVPHRFENLLVDSVEMVQVEGETRARLSLNIGEKDELGRQLFFKQNGSSAELIVPFFMEILALGSIVCSDKLIPGQTVFFTGISNFALHSAYAMGKTITGEVKKIKDKGPFLLCSGKIFEGDQCLAEGEMMAFFSDPNHPETDEKPKKKSAQILETNGVVVRDESKSVKSKFMQVVDSLVYQNQEAGRYIFEYTYPKNHPLIRGHFPQKPLMMGVMQWMMVEDACELLANQVLNMKSVVFKGNAEIVKEEGTAVAELKGFEVQVLNGIATLKSTSKIQFRDFVTPGEKVMLVLEGLEIHS